jgi:MFS family permease
MLSGETGHWPTARRAWGFVALLFITYVVAFIDRTILSLLIEPIKVDLGLSDLQIGLVSGLAFGVFYSVMGLPLGYMVDHVNRSVLLSVCVAVWSVATAASGLAQSFGALFVTRILVGIGEAALAPAALSLISDLFAPAKRSFAVAVFVMAGSIGGGLALALGGILLNWLNALESIDLALIGSLSPWRACFVFVGLPGLLLATVYLIAKEPQRKTSPPAQKEKRAELLDGETLVEFLLNGRTGFLPLTAAMTLLGIYAYGLLTWVPTHFIRQFSWTAADIGFVIGIILLVCGALGALCGGRLAQYMGKKGRGNANTLVVFIGLIALAIFASIATIMPTSTATLIFLCPALFFTAFPSGAAAAAVQEFGPVQLRGRVTAVYYIIMNLFGLSLGAPLVALLSIHLFGGSLGKALSSLALTLIPCAVYLAWLAKDANTSGDD